MDQLVSDIEELKDSEIAETIEERMNEFEGLGNMDNSSIFKELCFCITTANFNAERSIKMQSEIDDGYCELPEDELVEKLREFGHRFPNARAGYIVEAREHKDSVKENIEKFESEADLRHWLAKNVKGLGYKESSHFLRNIGFKNLAIIDFHIIDLLVRHGIIDRPKTLTPSRYMRIESVLAELADKTGLSLAELDLYLWYMETGKVLK